MRLQYLILSHIDARVSDNNAYDFVYLADGRIAVGYDGKAPVKAGETVVQVEHLSKIEKAIRAQVEKAR